MKTLIIDGNNLLSIGYYGRKNYFHHGIHIGGILHFINTLKNLLVTYEEINKVCVFWDGENSTQNRKSIYPNYKLKEEKDEAFKISFEYQKERVKQYLEELYIRQCDFINCECDDLISYYVKNSNEKHIIVSSDKDMLQLVNENTDVFDYKNNKYYDINSKVLIENFEIKINNLKLIKTLCGDISDNVVGVKGLGMKKLIKIIPNIIDEDITFDYFLNNLNDENVTKKLKNNILNGVTKYGEFGLGLYELNYKLLCLDELFLTNDAIEYVDLLINEHIDGENRSYKNIIKMINDDGLSSYLPKDIDELSEYFQPFLTLIRREKNSNYLKTKTYELQRN